jgi:hypothetical protein
MNTDDTDQNIAKIPPQQANTGLTGDPGIAEIAKIDNLKSSPRRHGENLTGKLRNVPLLPPCFEDFGFAVQFSILAIPAILAMFLLAESPKKCTSAFTKF